MNYFQDRFVFAVVSECLFALYDIITLVCMTAVCEKVVAEAKRTSRILDSLVSAKINGKGYINLIYEVSL